MLKTIESPQSIDGRYILEGRQHRTDIEAAFLLKEQTQREIILGVLDEIITPEQILHDLQELHSPAPSGTVLHTRTPVIVRLLEDAGISHWKTDSRIFGTRSLAVFLNVTRGSDDPPYEPRPYVYKPIWFSAHADQPTYLPYAPTRGMSFDIMPICAHRPTKTDTPLPKYPAAVIRYFSKPHHYKIIDRGVIGTHDNMQPYYKTASDPSFLFHPGRDRIVYLPELSYDEASGFISGNMDNAAGVAACTTAIRALKVIADRLGVPPELFKVGWVFPDEEEGLPEDPAYFGKEARRIIHRADAPRNVGVPEIIINIDGHDTSEAPPSTALYGAYVSKGKGPIVPPDMYAYFHTMLIRYARHRISTKPTESVERASLSRSNDAADMEKTYCMPIGYGIRDPHHNRGIATVNIHSLINLAKVMTLMAATYERH